MSRSRFIVVGLCLSALGFQVPVHAQEAQTPDEANTQHLEEMKKRVGRLSMNALGGARQTQPLLLQPPVMRSPNKGENHDGAVWLWLDGKRPIAVVSLWNRGPVWYSENTTLSDEALEVIGWPDAKWTPPSDARRWIAQKEPVPESPAARQRIMREISRKFTAREDRLGIKSELRLMPRPLHIYDDPDHDVIEGGLFALVLGTDPELLMQVEARTVRNARQWQVTFARMASAEITVWTGEQVIWTAAAVPTEYKTRHDTGYCIVREPGIKK